MSVSQANTPGRFLSQGENRMRCGILDFKAMRAREGFAKMSVSVIREEQSENTDPVCFHLSSGASVEGRLSRGGGGLPSCSTQNNTKSVSNPQSSSLIQNNCQSL